MRLASYNHMFGCDGRSLSEFLWVHALHALKRYEKLEARVRLEDTIQTIEETDADVIGINEVLGERQREQLQKLLKELGYKNFHFAQGHALSESYGGCVESLLATREGSECVYKAQFTVPAELGYGGGVMGIHIPSQDLYVFQLHLPQCKSKTRTSFDEQVLALLSQVEQLQADKPHLKAVLMGDFNCSYADLLTMYPDFSKFQRLSPDEPSCSNTNILRHFYKKDLDFVLGMGLQAAEAGMLEAKSDHSLLWVGL